MGAVRTRIWSSRPSTITVGSSVPSVPLASASTRLAPFACAADSRPEVALLSTRTLPKRCYGDRRRLRDRRGGVRLHATPSRVPDQCDEAFRPMRPAAVRGVCRHCQRSDRSGVFQPSDTRALRDRLSVLVEGWAALSRPSQRPLHGDRRNGQPTPPPNHIGTCDRAAADPRCRHCARRTHVARNRTRENRLLHSRARDDGGRPCRRSCSRRTASKRRASFLRSFRSASTASRAASPFSTPSWSPAERPYDDSCVSITPCFGGSSHGRFRSSWRRISAALAAGMIRMTEAFLAPPMRPALIDEFRLVLSRQARRRRARRQPISCRSPALCRGQTGIRRTTVIRALSPVAEAGRERLCGTSILASPRRVAPRRHSGRPQCTSLTAMDTWPPPTTD